MNDQQLLRYSRHILLPEIDIEGQQRLLDASVLIVGLGGLGSAAALYLAAAGVGHLTLVDFDEVDLSNLQRQIIHTEARVGQSKAESAREAIAQVNGSVDVKAMTERLTQDALDRHVAEVDLVLDCTDRFSSRYAINQACCLAERPLVSAAAIGFSGQLAVFDLRKEVSPCYACLYGGDTGEDSATCAESGVAAPLVGIMGSWQALEALKLMTGAGTPVAGLTLFDGLRGEWRQLGAERDASCDVCRQFRSH